MDRRLRGIDRQLKANPGDEDLLWLYHRNRYRVTKQDDQPRISEMDFASNDPFPFLHLEILQHINACFLCRREIGFTKVIVGCGHGRNQYHAWLEAIKVKADRLNRVRKIQASDRGA